MGQRMGLVRTAGWFLLVLTALWIAFGLFKGWGIGLDFANFYDAGRKARAGEFADLYDPFAMIAGRPPLGNMTFYSAPITAWLYAPMAALPPRTAMLAFKAAGTVALFLALMLLWRGLAPLHARAPGRRDRFFLAWALAILLFQPFWTIYRVGGQTTPFVLLAMAGGLTAALSGRMAAAAVLCACAVLIKPVLAPAAVLIFLLSDTRFRAAALIAGGVLAGLSLWLHGLALHARFLDLLAAETRKLLIPTLNSAPFSFLEPILAGADAYRQGGDAPQPLRAVLTGLRLAAATALLVRLRQFLRAPLAPAARTWLIWSAGLFLALILSPVVWAHYLAFAFPLIALFGAVADRLPGAARLHLGLIVGLAAFQHRMVIEALERLLGNDGVPALVAIGLLKSLLLLLLLGFLALWRHQIARAIGAAPWPAR